MPAIIAHIIKKDKAAVLAGLTLPHSNGVVKAKVHKLKFLNPYGVLTGAQIVLLRQQGLHAL